jgi:glutamate-1-semialdehyde 2,1-aminomutase
LSHIGKYDRSRENAAMIDVAAMRAKHDKLIPMGTQVSSKGRFRYCDGIGPAFITQGDGCRVLGSDSRWYIDWTMGLGAVTLGHGRGFSGDAIAWPLPSFVEVILAEKIQSLMPSMEMMRFLKTGTDATSAAIRLARAFTGREKIVRCGYHGWQDWALNADYAEKQGVPECVRDMTMSVSYGNSATLDGMLSGDDVAAVIVEPAPLCAPSKDFLSRAKTYCEATGTVLIFDEVITGFRMAPGGCQSVVGVTPHLTAAGKALANGHAISVVGGRADIMQKVCDTHISGTHFGEVTAMRAALYNLEQMAKDSGEAGDFWGHQSRVGTKLINAYTEAVAANKLEDRTSIRGMAHHSVIEWKNAAEQTLFQQVLLSKGVLVASGQFICLAHDREAVEKTVAAYGDALKVVAEAIADNEVQERLKCPVNMTVFRR